MSSLADHLPDRFPVGTRYVIEARSGGAGDVPVHSRYLEYPDGRRVELPEWPCARADEREVSGAVATHVNKLTETSGRRAGGPRDQSSC
jgi:hypothetical protein